jgi:hypothetical protein
MDESFMRDFFGLPAKEKIAVGITLRDYFAAHALTGLIINPATVNTSAPLSARAYEIADAMLAAKK